jgi:hypothetical protein
VDVVFGVRRGKWRRMVVLDVFEKTAEVFMLSPQKKTT